MDSKTSPPAGDDKHNDRVTEALNAEDLAEEVKVTQYSPWSPALLKLYLVLVIPYLCGALNGFDGSLMGGINAMKKYQEYFGM